MTVTSVYSFGTLLTRVLPGAEPAENSDTVGLANGGFATVADFPDGRSSASIYDAAGTAGLRLGPDAHDSQIAQLSTGATIVAGTDNAGGITVYTSDGRIRPITTDARETNADVAALAGGGFVVVSQGDYTANVPGDHDIRIYICDSAGNVINSLVAANSSLNDQNPSVATLADGGFVVAWERINPSGTSGAWVAVFDSDGTPRGGGAPYLYSGGFSAHDVNVTALQNGGFAISYENVFSQGGQSEIRVAISNSAGQVIWAPAASDLPNDESGAAVTTLSNGLILTTFANLADVERDDYNVHATLFDPADGGNALTDITDPLNIGDAADSIFDTSVSALSLAQFVVSYTSLISGDVTQQTMQLVRTVTGDAADDNFAGDDAVDIVYGLGGDDILSGGANTDTLGGGLGNDYLHGGAGNDTLNGDANNDFLVGGDGEDRLDGGVGADAMVGGSGNDIFVVDNASDEVSESSTVSTEIDTVQSSVTFTLGANLENLTLIGPSAINGTGNALANTITGNGATNTLGGLGGNDTYFINNLTDVVVEGTGQGIDDVILTSVTYIMGAATQVETLRTTSDVGTTAINLTGNGFAQTIIGNNGVNLISGGGSADIMRGLSGNDTYVVDSLDDLVEEGAGQGTADRVLTSTSYTLGAAAQIELFTTTNAAGTGAINLTGNGFNQTIAGNAGNNIIDGKGGADNMQGFAGDDWYYVDNTADVVLDGAGQGTADRVLASVSYTLGASAQVELLTTTNAAGTGAINLTGNGFAQSIGGNAGANVLNGGGGADTLTGFAGNDQYYVDNIGDVVVEGAGQGTADRVLASVSYVLGAAAQVELFTTTNSAGTGAINLTGNGFAQSIGGNAGANVLNGGLGNDTLTGFGGLDTFFFNTALGAGNVDRIADFNVAQDTIRLENAIFAGLATGALAAGAFNTGAAATQADDRIIYNAATGALIFDADGVGGNAGIQFATLNAGLGLTSADFAVI